MHCSTGQTGHSGIIAKADSTDTEPRWMENGNKMHEVKQKAKTSNVEKCGLLVNDEE